MPKQVDAKKATELVEAKGFACVEPLEWATKKMRFRCFCGREFETVAQKILSGHTKSCGCIKGLKKRKGTDHVPGTYFSRLRQAAAARGIEFAVTVEFLSSLLVNQGFKCALSGLPIKLVYGIEWGRCTASVDRRDNSLGYTPSNVQWVHKDINWMKQDFAQDYFLSLCESVTRNVVEHQPALSC